MIKGTVTSRREIQGIQTTQGETIEEKCARIMQNGEPIS